MQSVFQINSKGGQGCNMKKFWEYGCRKCHLQIQFCQCDPIPCPFCEAEFDNTQDWNVHINDKHPKETMRFVMTE